MTKQRFNTREEWLSFVTAGLRPAFAGVGAPIPAKVRFAIGFTSAGYRSKAIGECWSTEASGDRHAEIFIKPDQDNAEKVAGILAHELVHAAVGVEEGHKGRFRTTCKALGFEGPMRSTLPGEVMMDKVVRPILVKAGELPHKKLRAYKVAKKQGTRLLKAECNTCGYTVRVTKKWIEEAGAPYCGHKSHGRMLCEDIGGEDGEGEGE
jgi:hypothetical protein